jgi:hypothetical protein
MKKVLALSIATVMCLGVASHAFAGANPLWQLALDVQLKSKTRTCTSMAAQYSSCSVVVQSASPAPGTANLDIVPVMYGFTGLTAVEFGVDWHSSSYIYSPIWTKCSDFEIVEATATTLKAALAWSNCTAPAGTPGVGGKPAGFLRFNSLAGPQRLDIIPSQQGFIQMLDCDGLLDEVHTIHHGFYGGAVPGPGDRLPCDAGPTAATPSTWSGVKALYR